MTGTEGVQLLQSFSNAVAELAQSVSPSVVSVNVERRGGTGMIWSAEGLVVTASHVVGHSAAPTVTLWDGSELEARVLGSDPFTDVALLKVEATRLNPIRVGNADGVRVGQFVLALANAFGRRVSATSGIITSHRRSMRGFWGVMIEDAVVSDARLNPGYSGGPLVDASGNLLGMNVAYFGGRGVAVYVDALKEIIGKLMKNGKVKKGFLGVVVEPVELPDELAKNSQVGQQGGLLVRSVEAASPAKAAGVAMGDIILRLGDLQATDEYELHRALSGEVVGKPVNLRLLRAEKVTDLKITPKEAEA
jgi:S1-C subfamily serine protease